MPSDETFGDVLRANHEYAEDFRLAGIEARAARGLAIVTCIDSRIEPLDMLGLQPGDAKIIRNAGGRVTADVLADLVLASHLLGVTRTMVIAHTDCRMSPMQEDDLHDALRAAGAPDTRELSFRAAPDQEAALRADVELLRGTPHLARVQVGGFRYDVSTGRVTQIC
ncbi:MAG: carbonic anhydrase [Gaiellales bacterium]|nr:carbonic anhydrase [Gaiellales bacterium]